MNVLTALMQSRKAWVLVAATVVVIVLAVMHFVTGAQALDFVKWLVIAWFGAVAVEDGAQKMTVPSNVMNVSTAPLQLSAAEQAARKDESQ